MSKKPKVKPYAQILLEDLNEIKMQDPCVAKLYMECVTAERYGDGFKAISINMSEKSFRKAKTFLEQGYFEFKPVCAMSSSNRIMVTGWTVRNLRGVKSGAWVDLSKYHEFLQSDYWKYVRAQIIERDNNCCQECGTKYNLQVHHLTYENHGYEHEHPEDLITLCRGCHEEAHSIA